MLNNPDFYPTPSHIIAKMVAPYRNKSRLQILEPSAGKGDILDYLRDVCRINKTNLYCIESDPELVFTLQGKGYSVIDRDFLTYSGHHQFNLIVMNPPFADGADHLLKAWEVLAYGDIVCLLNRETITNPHTAKRRVLAQLIQQHGTCEEIGQPFLNGERRTAVDVVLVRLHKEQPKSSVNFDAGSFSKDRHMDDAEFSANPLAHGDIIQSLVDQFNVASRITVEMHRLDAQRRFYLSGISDRVDDDPKLSDLNEKLEELKERFWRYIFNKTKIGQVTTSDFQKKFFSFQADTSHMAFSVENIHQVLRQFYESRFDIMEECLLSVFDQATKYHEKNVVHTEGWKTNKSWKINRKIIMPNGISFDTRWGTWGRHYYNSSSDFFFDIDKVCCMLSGRKYEHITDTDKAISERMTLLNRGEVDDYTEQFCSTFFRIRFFKKGTVHLEFLDEDLWHEFNKRAAQGKNWVGPGY